MFQDLSEQEAIRRESLKELEKLGINAYPAEAYNVNITTAEIHKNFTAEKWPLSGNQHCRPDYDSPDYGCGFIR